MPRARKTWAEKLDTPKDLPKIVKLDERQAKRFGRGTMVIPAPRDVDSLMRRVRRGSVTTINDLRAKLARDFETTTACPITTGIFAWIAAHAAEEAAAAGARAITPWWRTLKGEGELNDKYPGGAARQRELLEAEGHKVLAKGKKLVVQPRAAARLSAGDASPIDRSR
jgi:hypothetical protein